MPKALKENMNKKLFAMVGILMLFGALGAHAAPLGADASVDQVLDALAERGKTLNEFTADIRYTDTDLTMGDSTTRLGKVWYQRKGDGDARMHILLDKKVVGDKTSDDRREYVLQDGWALTRDYRAKNEVKYQIARPGEKVNLFALGKGAFPLPIGQEKKDVEAMFEVKKMEAGKDDPTNTIHLQLTPKAKTEFADRFSTVDVWVDRSTEMPVRVSTVDRNGAMEQSTDLEHVVVNPDGGLKDADFVMPEVQGWTRHEEAMGNGG
jgi:outer membrane lipoprotein-sorting protein